MNADRSARALHHLTLALAGVGLTLAELPFLPWLPFGLILYLMLLLTAHSLRGSYVLPAWAANGLALLIAGGAVATMVVRSGADDWASDVPLLAALVPYLGPVLMALLCVRLFRPRSRDDFWLLQGLGLLQIGLGCVLASGTLFALAFFAYLVTAAGALAAGERHRRGRRSASVLGPPARPAGWMPFGLRWGLGVGLLAVPLFLLTPRTDTPDWDPLQRFGLRAPRAGQARTGFSEEIDLSRTGRLVPDDAPAFWVEARGRAGRPADVLAPETRFRGVVLDRYEQGVWRSESIWPGGLPLNRRRPRFLDLGPDALECRFKVPRRTGGLFLIDPIPPTAVENHLPLRALGEAAEGGPLFVDVGGTPAPLTYLTLSEYRYEQQVLPGRPTQRVRASAQKDSYLTRLLRGHVPGLEAWTRELLARARPADEGLRRALRETPGELPPMWWEPMARSLSEHLARSGEYGYSLETVRGDEGLDPTIDFLLYVKSGPCERYASALALMLRSQGVPCRLVKGYRGAERQGAGLYVVRQSSAHAWVEALVPAEGDGEGYEWLTLDPTPDGETVVSTLARWWQQQQQQGQEFWSDLVVNYNRDQRARVLDRLTSPDTYLRLLEWLTVMAAFGAGAWLLRRLWLPGAAPAVLGATTLLARMRRLTVAGGAEANATAGEAAEAGRRWLLGRGLGPLADVPAEVAALYYRVRFGGESAGDDELRRASARLDELEAALGATT